MQSSLFVLLWRRKVSLLLIGASLVLLALWTWAFLDANDISDFQSDERAFSRLGDKDTPYRHTYVLQKLISQANRVLRHQRLQELQDHKSSKPLAPAAAHTGQSLGIVRFVKPTKSPPLGIVEEVSAQTLSLVARHRKAPLIGQSFLFEEERLKILEQQQRAKNAAIDEMANNNMEYESNLSAGERQRLYDHELQRIGVPIVAGVGPEGVSPPKERIVHFDLKGAPPKLSFLKRLLPMLKTLGATGLLLEYEDMFPYTGALEAVSAKNAYKREDLRDFLEAAAMLGFTIMPLVQTFGHMEYALKLQGFEQMRESPDSPESLCPSRPDSVSFVEELVTQIIEFHMSVGLAEGAAGGRRGIGLPMKFSHIHIGCDEVLRLGECDKCRQRSRNEVFLTHVTTVSGFIRSRWPQLGVVIWDDMLRDMTLTELQHSNIGSYVEPMIWVYVPDIYHFINPLLWNIYAQVFPTAWAASAFKGASVESQMIPPLQHHLENNIRWLAVIGEEGARFAKGFRGLALTGWQRYDHFGVLCELLPVAIPSLITSLSTVSKGHFSVIMQEHLILKVLTCSLPPDTRRATHPWIVLTPDSHHGQLFSTCTYLGSGVYKFALRLVEKLAEVHGYLARVQEHSAWMSDYNVRHNFSSPMRVRGLSANTPSLINELTALSKEAYEVMYEVYDEHTIAEFVEQNVFPLVASLRRHLDSAQFLLQRKVWPQRPLPYARELIDLGLIPNATPKDEPMSHDESNG